MTNPYPYIDNDQWRQAYDCAMATAYSYWRKLCKILPPHIDLDDFQAAARLGLHKASLKFDPGRGTRFNTLAVWWVRAMCEWEFRSNYHLPRAQAQRARKAGRLAQVHRRTAPYSLDAPVGDPGGAPMRLVDTLEAEVPAVGGRLERELLAQQVRDALARLPPHQREAAELCWLREMSLTAAGKEIGIHKEAVRQRLLKAQPVLRELLEQEGVCG